MARIDNNPYTRLKLACARLHPTDAACLRPRDAAGFTAQEAGRRASIAEALAEGRSVDADALRRLVLDQLSAAGNCTESLLWCDETERHTLVANVACCNDLSTLLTWLRTVRATTLDRNNHLSAA